MENIRYTESFHEMFGLDISHSLRAKCLLVKPFKYFYIHIV